MSGERAVRLECDAASPVPTGSVSRSRLWLLKTLRRIAPISPVVFMPTFLVGVLPKPFDLTRLTRAVVDAAGW